MLLLIFYFSLLFMKLKNSDNLIFFEYVTKSLCFNFSEIFFLEKFQIQFEIIIQMIWNNQFWLSHWINLYELCWLLWLFYGLFKIDFGYKILFWCEKFFKFKLYFILKFLKEDVKLSKEKYWLPRLMSIIKMFSHI